MPGFHTVGFPVKVFMAAIRWRVTPPILLNFPPAYNVFPLMARPLIPPVPPTKSPTFGFQLVRFPVVRSNEARRLRSWLPMRVKVPPAYNVFPLRSSTLNQLSAFGFQAVACPLPASSAARRLRVCPPMLVKPPPANTVLPWGKIHVTTSLAAGFHEVASPVVASMAAM